MESQTMKSLVILLCVLAGMVGLVAAIRAFRSKPEGDLCIGCQDEGCSINDEPCASCRDADLYQSRKGQP